MTPSTPRSSSIGAEISPVKAPSSASCMFCAATRTRLWKQCSTAVFSEVKGGQMTTSGPPDSGHPRQELVEEALGLLGRLVHLPVGGEIAPYGQASCRASTSGQLSALHQLERGATAGREPVDRVGQSELLQRRHGIAAADHRVTRRGRDRLGDGSRAAREGLELEGAHRPVPEDGPGPRDPLAEVGGRVAADVEAHPALGHVDAVELAGLGVRRRTPCRGTRSSGSSRIVSLPSASSSTRLADSTPSSSTSELPVSRPSALKKLKHIAPPIRISSAKPRKRSITPSLSVTLAPPRTMTSGRCGSSRTAVSSTTSRSSSRPA